MLVLDNGCFLFLLDSWPFFISQGCFSPPLLSPASSPLGQCFTICSSYPEWAFYPMSFLFQVWKKGGRSSLWPHLSLTWNSFWLGCWFGQSPLPDPTVLRTVYKSLVLLHPHSSGASGGGCSTGRTQWLWVTAVMKQQRSFGHLMYEPVILKFLIPSHQAQAHTARLAAGKPIERQHVGTRDSDFVWKATRWRRWWTGAAKNRLPWVWVPISFVKQSSRGEEVK